MDSNNNSMAADWRTKLWPESRDRIVNKIGETLKRHLPISGPEGLVELRKIAVRFEEMVYSTASSQSDYIRKISSNILTFELRMNQNPPDPALTGHSDVVDSQEVDQKGLQSSDDEEFDDVPDEDEYDTEDSFIDDAELGLQSSDDEEFDDVPDDDEYDTEDSFIDDAELERSGTSSIL